MRLLLVPCLLLVACRGGEKKAEERHPPLATVAALDAIPAEAHVVVGVNVTRLRDSALARRAVTRLLADDPGSWTWLTDLLARCHVDPARDLDRILVGAERLDGGELVLVAEGALDETRITTCIREAVAEKGGTLETQSLAGGAPAYHASVSAGAPGGWFAWGGPRTLLVATSEAWLAKARDPASPKVKTAGDIRPLLERCNADKAVWGAALLPPDAGGALAAVLGAAGKPARALYGDFDATGGLSIEIEAEWQTDADARGVYDFGMGELRKLRLLAQAAGLSAAANQIRLDNQGRTVKASLALGAREAEDLLARLDKHGLPEPPAVPEEGAPR